jgi:hypothetical protein
MIEGYWLEDDKLDGAKSLYRIDADVPKIAREEIRNTAKGLNAERFLGRDKWEDDLKACAAEYYQLVNKLALHGSWMKKGMLLDFIKKRYAQVKDKNLMTKQFYGAAVRDGVAEGLWEIVRNDLRFIFKHAPVLAGHPSLVRLFNESTDMTMHAVKSAHAFVVKKTKIDTKGNLTDDTLTGLVNDYGCRNEAQAIAVGCVVRVRQKKDSKMRILGITDPMELLKEPEIVGNLDKVQKLVERQELPVTINSNADYKRVSDSSALAQDVEREVTGRKYYRALQLLEFGRKQNSSFYATTIFELIDTEDGKAKLVGAGVAKNNSGAAKDKDATGISKQRHHIDFL